MPAGSRQDFARFLRHDGKEPGLASIAAIMTNLPDSELDRVTALTQRTTRIIQIRAPKELIRKFGLTSRWCGKKLMR